MTGNFFGGVRPAPNKGATDRKEIRTPQPPGKVIIPMSMHVGAQCCPLVKKGDEVRLGQPIGSSDDSISAPIHASVSGTITAVEPRQHPNGSMVMSVEIANDFKDTPGSELESHTDISSLSAEELTELIRSAGIVGLGGAGFPTHSKIIAGLGKVNTLIINGSECEPYVTSGYRGLLEHAEEILGGARILMKVFGLTGVTIGIERNKSEAARRLKGLLSSSDEGIHILPLRARYPQGAEKQLIQAVTGRQVPPGELPSAVGCAVFSTDTVRAIYRAVYFGTPLIEKVVTVSGPVVANPDNLRVRIGTPLSELFSACGGFREAAHKILMGGPMMGLAQYDLGAPVIKTTSAVLAFGEQECGKSYIEQACIRCARCADACPMHLQPMLMYAYEKKDKPEELEKLNLTDCIECGSCEYVCPGRLLLMQSIKSGKQKLLSRQAKEAME